ncbi:MAG: hypothetical protein NVSMB29_03620 [Candidatus Dormibacteria bacterium]
MAPGRGGAVRLCGLDPRDDPRGIAVSRTWVRLAGILLIGLLAFAVAAGGLRLAQTAPAPAVQLSAAESPDLTAGAPPDIASPSEGSLDLEDGSHRQLAALAADQVRAIGSVAKTMTALVVLEKFPLRPGDPGVTYTITAQDVADYQATVAANGSNLPVTVGERLSERELLLGLMLPSANNLALTLARWAAGDPQAFVTLLNARAAGLGMAHTHFDDASGFSPATVSTARDLVRLGRAALTNPGLADIVGTAKAPLPPDGALYYNLDTLLGTTPGWLGIKTGETPSAGACLLFAARSTLAGGATVLLVGAVLGQPQLGDALAAARASVQTAARGYLVVDWAATPPSLRGEVAAPWGARAGVRLGVPSAPDTALHSVLRRGEALVVTANGVGIAAPLPEGARVGTVEVSSPTGQLLVRWPVLLRSPLPGPSVWWRLQHG